jgi:hypothetical protein
MDDDWRSSIGVFFKKLGMSAFSSEVVSNAKRDADVRQVEFRKGRKHRQPLDFG